MSIDFVGEEYVGDFFNWELINFSYKFIVSNLCWVRLK